MAYIIKHKVTEKDTEWNSIIVVNNAAQPVKWRSLYSVFIEGLVATDIVDLTGQFVASSSGRANMGLSTRIFAIPADAPFGTVSPKHATPNITAELSTSMSGGEWDGTSTNVSQARNHETVTCNAEFTGLTGDYYFNLCAWGLDSTLVGMAESFFTVASGNGAMKATVYGVA